MKDSNTGLIAIIGLVTVLVVAAVTNLAPAGAGSQAEASNGYATAEVRMWQATADGAALQAHREWLETDTLQRAQPAAVLSQALHQLAVGLASLILAVGLALALVVWLGKRAATIYPNRAGQYPLIVRKGFGWVAYHDPNRGLGPTTIYKTPTLLDAWIEGLARLRGQPAAPHVEASFPLPASEATAAQIATQAQAGQVAVAQNMWPPLAAGAASRRSGTSLPGRSESCDRMPVLQVVTDPVQIQEAEKRFDREDE